MGIIQNIIVNVLRKQYKNVDIYIFRKMPIKTYTRRAIDKYQSEHKEEIKEYKKKWYLERKLQDKRIPEFKVLCKIIL